MDRRTLLVAGGAIAVAGLTGAPARAAARRPIFEWARPGGYFAPGEGILTPPPLAVYDDNTAYADAAAGLRLHPSQVEALRADAVRVLSNPRDTARVLSNPRDTARVLSNPRDTARDPGRPDRDHPVDLVSVRTDDDTYLTVEFDDFPAALRALDQQIQTLRRTVLKGGEPWRPNAILLATVRLDEAPDSSAPWPDGLARPDTGVRYAEQFPRDRQAQLVRRVMPARPQQWPAYRTSPAGFVRATWRHLLPHEL